MPEISVIMAVRDGARWLGEAIASVVAQTHGDWELIVVDDGSTDGSGAIVQRHADPRIRFVQNDRMLGQTASLNLGLGLARGRFVARLDADDRAHPTRLARQVAVLRAEPGLALVGTQAWRIDDRGRRNGTVERPCAPASVRWYGLFDNPFIHSAVMTRRALVDEVGGYDAAFDYAQDYDLWSRLLARGEGRNLPEKLVDYRTHAGSRTGAVVNGVGAHQRSGAFAARLSQVIGGNVAVVFGEAPADADVELMCGYALGLETDAIPRFMTLFERLLRRYRTRHREATAAADFARTVARQYDAVALRARPASRRLALRVYATALRGDPHLARWLSWPRVLALSTVGRPALEHLRAAWR